MKRFLSAVVASFCLLTAAVAFDGENFSLTPPEGWADITQQIPRKDLLAAFGKADRTGLLLIKQEEKKLTVPFDEAFAKEFDRGVESGNGGKCILHRFFEQDGLKCYETLCEFPVGGKTASSAIRMVLVNDTFYQVQGMCFDGQKATEHAELKAAMDSFRIKAAVK